jgi:hypothetical protein
MAAVCLAAAAAVVAGGGVEVRPGEAVVVVEVTVAKVAVKVAGLDVPVVGMVRNHHPLPCRSRMSGSRMHCSGVYLGRTTADKT